MYGEKGREQGDAGDLFVRCINSGESVSSSRESHRYRNNMNTVVSLQSNDNVIKCYVIKQQSFVKFVCVLMMDRRDWNKLNTLPIAVHSALSFYTGVAQVG